MGHLVKHNGCNKKSPVFIRQTCLHHAAPQLRLQSLLTPLDAAIIEMRVTRTESKSYSQLCSCVIKWTTDKKGVLITDCHAETVRFTSRHTNFISNSGQAGCGFLPETQSKRPNISGEPIDHLQDHLFLVKRGRLKNDKVKLDNFTSLITSKLLPPPEFKSHPGILTRQALPYIS